ncbi:MULTISPECIES: hypothetical protein [unclassified Thioalkalivibrio]|uniref:hypothetical protein n=1 Tax=unclassified Thioalkalivibrio TaxID=2621013 RepID=UPI000364C532|nr:MULTISPECIES: hypothetical protein [unclassified Thioalkalivibrio]
MHRLGFLSTVWLLVALALGSVAGQAAANDSALARLAAGLQPGELAPLDAGLPEGFQRYHDFLRAYSIDPDTWNDSAHWHPERRQAFMFGDRGSTPVFITYSEDQHEWRYLSAEGPPPFAHVYGGVALDPERGHYYKISAGRSQRTLHRYSIAEDRWELATRSLPGPGGGWEHTDPIEWHDALDQLIYIRENQVYGLRDGRWTEHGKVAVDGYHSSAQYNRVRDEMLFIGGNKSRNKVSLLDANGAVRDLGDAPFVFGIMNGSLTYDPQTGNYLVLRAGRTRELWELDPDKDEWRKAADWGGQRWPFDRYGGIVPVPIDDFGVILWLNQAGPLLHRHQSAFGQERTGVTLPPPADGRAEFLWISASEPEPAPERRSQLYDIAETLEPGEFRRVETRLPEGVPDMARMNNTQWHDPDKRGTFGVGWTDRHIFDPETGRLFNILMRDSSVRSVTWLEPDLTWAGVVAPPGLDYDGGERRPYNRLMDGGDGYLYFSPSEPRRSDIGRLVRAPYTDPTAWEEIGLGAGQSNAHIVGDHSTVWHPDIEKFVLYTLGPASYDHLPGDGIEAHTMGQVRVWGHGDRAWTYPRNHPDYRGPEGRTQSSGYGGTTLYNPVRREVLIYGGMTQYGGNHRRGAEATATIDREGRFQRHGPSGQRYVAGGSRLTYHPGTGDYILLQNNARQMFIGDPPRGKPWRLMHNWEHVPYADRPFDRYENWHRVTPLPGTDVLIWSDLRRGIILQRLPEGG